MSRFLSHLRVHLKIGIAAAFASVMIPLTLGVVGYLYYNNVSLALATADQSMTKASEAIAQDVDNLLNPAARVVEAASVLLRIDRGALRRPDGLRYFFDQMEKLPQIYSLFIGFGADGSFYQVIRLPESLKSFGPSGLPVPEGARHALRLLDASSGAMRDSFIYFGQWGDIRGVDRGPAKYDPRQRPWYKAAWEENATRISDVYTFASTGTPGLTVSKRAATEAGLEIGAIGADITLDALSVFLDRKKIGKEGRVFILDGEGRLIGHQNPALSVRVHEGKVELLKAVEVADPIVAQSVRLRESGLGDRFTASLGEDRENYMLSFTPFPKEFGKDWVIGVAAKELEFIGPLREASLRILLAGLLGIILASLAINWLSRLLTRPLQMIVDEAGRIQKFDLEGDNTPRTRIIEVDELALAVQNMKRSLRSFSVYVPKDLVRMILASGQDIETGGERRKLAIMFSDIKGFTKNVETMPPEQVMESLSEYFKHMSRAIHAHKGIVDKFIGDAIMAIWNAPQPDPDPMGNACRALLACKTVGDTLNRDFQSRGLPPFFTRFGLHAGDVVVGNVGSQDRMQYTALGSEVNLASRLEALNKQYGTQLLVSETVAAELHDRFLFRMIDLVVPVGTSRPIAIFELVSELPAMPEDKERCRKWELAFNHYLARQWDKALDGFKAFLQAYPEDGAVNVFIARCKDYSMQPPPADWDAAQRLDHK